MMPSYFYISKCSQAAVFSLSGSELYGTQLRARTFQMRTSRQLNGVDSVTVPVTGSLDQSQSHSQENSRLKRRDDVSLAADRPQSSAGFNTGAAFQHLIPGMETHVERETVEMQLKRKNYE